MIVIYVIDGHKTQELQFANVFSKLVYQLLLKLLAVFVSNASVWHRIGIGHFHLKCTWYQIGSENVVSVHHYITQYISKH